MRRSAAIGPVLVLCCLLAWPVRATQAPVTLQSRIAANGDGEAILNNQSAVSLTAYVFEVLREPCNPAQARERILRGYDARTAPDGKTVPPFGLRTENLGVSHCNKTGVHASARALLRAALFADGTKYGEKEFAEILLRHREWQLQRIDGVIRALKSGLERKITREEYVALLKERQVSLRESKDDSPPVEFADVDPWETALRQLTAKAAGPLPAQIEETLAVLSAMRNKVAE